jgi:hypothetical protein
MDGKERAEIYGRRNGLARPDAGEGVVPPTTSGVRSCRGQIFSTTLWFVPVPAWYTELVGI